MDLLSTPFGDVRLGRPNGKANDPRRSWDAADEFVLRHLADGSLAPGARVLVINGGAGALACALAAWRPTVVSDSFTDHRATVDHLVANGRTPDDVRLLAPLELGALATETATETATEAATGTRTGSASPGFDLAIVKVPKSSAFLDDELRRLAPLLAPGATVVGAGMVRHVHTSTVEAFETLIGPTTTTRAERKARLLLAIPDRERAPAPLQWPRTVPIGAGWVDGVDAVVVNHANVFSRDRLDPGTRLLLANLGDPSGPDLPTGADADGPRPVVVDLGCGNGIVGTAVAARWPGAQVVFVDDSFSAVAAAAATVEANLGSVSGHRFVVGDALDRVASGGPVAPASVSSVLVNPPFHDDHALGDATAWRMFTGAHRVLVRGGEIRVVGNRHLGYHAKLRRIFGNCEVVASDPRFVVFSARR